MGSAAAIQSDAEGNLVVLNAAKLTVTVTWTPNNNPGSSVQVVISCGFQALVIPISPTGLALKSTAVDIITQ
jgi:hypothetical protein